MSLLENTYVRVAILGVLVFVFIKFGRTHVEGLDDTPIATPPLPPAPTATQSAAVQPAADAAQSQQAPAVPAVAQVAADDADIFQVQGVELDDVFDNPNEMHPADLVPKVETDAIFDDLPVDPSLETNFLMNAYSYGIETSSVKRSFINDIRGGLPIQKEDVSPWGNPTRIGSEVTKRTLADVI
ncbi:hypothetical protein GGF32_006242 [Allomyces javanicus]|nr:hypothetical protein GGF32_006242 [Allomyces javanicus]